MYLVIGLGNPGEEYNKTRHNIGFEVVDRLAHDINLPSDNFKPDRKFKALISIGKIKETKVVIAKPQTYMNLSGEAAEAIASWHKIPTTHIIAAYDDLDLELGQIRIRRGGSSGGHRGIDSLRERLGGSDFIRVRVGIGRDERLDAKDYVLQKFSRGEESVISTAITSGAQAIQMIISDGLEKGMNFYSS